MTTTKSHDFLNRLTGIASVLGGTGILPVSFGYNYNQANQRTRATLADGSYWMYEYDTLGQAKSGKKYWSDGTPVAGQQFEYGFDDIGNRKNTKAGGDENGWNLRPANYGVNSLNQYTNRDVPGYVDIMGLSFATNSVTVNSQTAYRKGEYFRKELPVNNASASLWTNIIVAATGQTSVTGNVFVARTAETFGYDADGNMTNDGRWALAWDGENRLVNLTSLTNAPTGSKRKLDFVYDWQGRRIQKIISTNNGSSYVAQSTNRYVYHGWNLLAILNPQSSILQSFVWGLDLSGSPQGAGGVGGLLAVSDAANGVHFAAYDGNGNVMALVKGSDGTASANYEYGPFGEVLRVTGTMAKANPFRFSTKYQDEDTDLFYYGFRFYNSAIGRWLSRDRIGESGGINLKEFVRNNPVNLIDILGAEPLRSMAHKTFLEMNIRTIKSEMVRTMNKFGAIRKLESLVEEVTIVPYRGNPQYRNRRVYISVPWDGSTLAHEFVHAYNDIRNTGLQHDDIRDETVATAFEGLLIAAESVYFMETTLKHDGYCERASNGQLQKTWELFWKSFGDPSNYPRAWVDPGGFEDPIEVMLDVQDFRNLKTFFGFHLSCEELADHINAKLGEGCCYTVSCNREAKEPFEIAAGVKISPAFR